MVSLCNLQGHFWEKINLGEKWDVENSNNWSCLAYLMGSCFFGAGIGKPVSSTIPSLPDTVRLRTTFPSIDIWLKMWETLHLALSLNSMPFVRESPLPFLTLIFLSTNDIRFFTMTNFVDSNDLVSIAECATVLILIYGLQYIALVSMGRMAESGLVLPQPLFTRMKKCTLLESAFYVYQPSLIKTELEGISEHFLNFTSFGYQVRFSVQSKDLSTSRKRTKMSSHCDCWILLPPPLLFDFQRELTSWLWMCCVFDKQKSWRWERDMLAKRMRSRMTVEDKEQIFSERGIHLDCKQYKLQLCNTIWTDPSIWSTCKRVQKWWLGL